MKTRLCMLSCAVAGLLCSGAIADDVFAPNWRGDFLTVTAAWDYWGQEGPGPGTAQPGFYDANPGGLGANPALAYWGSNSYVHDNLFNRQSVLEIGVDSNPDTLQFGLLNYGNGDRKDILIQVTYYQGFGAPLSFDVGALTDIGSPPFPLTDTVAATVLDTMAHPDGWVTSSYGFSLTPKPQAEGLQINFTSYPAYIDQVVIDTRSIPSPGALGVVLIAGVAVSSRRRR